jgi:hypothetical protein
MPKKKKEASRIKLKKKVFTKIERRNFQTPLVEEEFPIELKRARALRKLKRNVVDQEEKGDKEFGEAGRDVFEDQGEKDEELGIEDDEEKGEYPYPGIEQVEKEATDEDEEE